MKNMLLQKAFTWPSILSQKFLQLRRSILVTCLMIPQFVSAAFWIDDFSGAAEDYRLIRQDKEYKIEAQMLLNTGDELKVLSKTETLHLVQDDNSEIVLTKQNTPFKIPESEPPPSIMGNIAALVSGWLTQSPGEDVKTVTLASRGVAPLLISAASDLENNLMAGLESLVVYWSGGMPPYHVRLRDEDNNAIIEKTNIQQNNVTLTDTAMPSGNYRLEILDEISSTSISLTAVAPDDAPSLFNKILESQAPIKIKQYYATMVLASQPKWLFQALQLTVRYDLQHVKQNILDGHVPDPIDTSLFKTGKQ